MAKKRRRTGPIDFEPSANGSATSTAEGKQPSTNNSTAVIPADAKFKTGPQVAVPSFSANKKKGGKLNKRPEINKVLFDRMMRDPTIRLAVDIIVAMLMRQPWGVEKGDPDYNEQVMKMIEPRREMMIRSTIRGLLRAGWRGFEVVYGQVDSVDCIIGIKALKNDITTPLAFADTGEFAGFENKGYGQYTETVIDAEHCIFVNFDDEGCGDLPDPLLKSVEGPFEKHEKCDEGAQRYDEKVAGGFLFGTYPVGATAYSVEGGAETDNAVIFQGMIAAITSSGWAGVPVKIDPETGEVRGKDAWSLEHIAAGGGLQPNFIARLKYLDALKLRAFGIPERATVEGQFGTKAEAAAHGDIAVLINLGRAGILLRAINDGPLRAINLSNHGDPDYCKLALGELPPEDRKLFGDIFTSLMGDPIFGDEVATSIDVKQLLKKLNVPTLSEEEIAQKEAEAEEKREEQQKQFLQGKGFDPDAEDEDEEDAEF